MEQQSEFSSLAFSIKRNAQQVVFVGHDTIVKYSFDDENVIFIKLSRSDVVTEFRFDTRSVGSIKLNALVSMDFYKRGNALICCFHAHKEVRIFREKLLNKLQNNS